MPHTGEKRWTVPVFYRGPNGEVIEGQPKNHLELNRSGPAPHERELTSNIPIEEYERLRNEQRMLASGNWTNDQRAELAARGLVIQPIPVPPDHILAINPAGHLVSIPETEVWFGHENHALPEGFRLATREDIEAKQAFAASLKGGA